MIRSNTLKTIPYPEEFTDEDKLEYDALYAQAKVIHADVEKDNAFIIHTAIVAHIRAKNGRGVDFTDEELEAVKNSYKHYASPDDKLIKTELPEDHYCYDKENNPMYFPATLTINADDGRSVSIEEQAAKTNSNLILKEEEEEDVH